MARALQQPSGVEQSRPVTVVRALAFVREHGVVLMAARGPVPTLTHMIAGGAVQGSWWGHPKGKDIFRILQSIAHSPEVLICRLIDGKITLVHRRLWPALVRAAAYFPRRSLARVEQEHSASGYHVNHEIPFPKWVPAEDTDSAANLTVADAVAALGPWVARAREGKSRTSSRSRSRG